MSRLLKSKDLYDSILAQGLLNEEQYQIFWSKVATNEENCAEFGEFLIKKLLVFDKKEQQKEEKRSKLLAKTKKIDVEFTRETYVNTLYFLALFLRVGSIDTKFLNAIAKLEKFGQDNNDPDLIEIAHMLTQRMVQSRQNTGATPDTDRHLQDILSGRLINNFINTITSHPRSEAVYCLRPGACFLWPFLRMSLSTGRYGDVCVKSLHGVLKLGSTMVSESRLVLIVHLLRCMFMSLPSSAPRPPLDGLLSSLAPFALWPEPYSTLVRRLQFILKQEQRAPGHVLRSTLATALLKSHQSNTDVVRPLHFVLHSPAETVSVPLANAPPKLTVKQLKLALVIDFVLGHLAVESNMNYQALSDDDLAQLFAEYTTITHQILDLKNSADEVQRIRLRGIRQLHERLRTALGAPTSTLASPALSHPYSHASIALTEGEFGRVSLETSDGSHDTNTPFLPRVTVFGPKYVAFPCDESSPVFVDKMLQSPAIPHLKAIIEEGIQAKHPGIRICIFGDDQVVNAVVSAYIVLLTTEPSLFIHTRIAFLLVPSPRPSLCSLAAFWATRDPVYRHTIFGPFEDPSCVLPVCVSETDTPVPTPTPPIPSPQLVFHHEMSHYIWNAQHINKVCVYQCEGQLDRMNSSETVILPFVNSMEISTAVESAATGKPAPPLEFTIRYQPINPQGHTTSSSLIEASHCLSSLIFSNVPTERTPQANPCTLGLDLVGTPPDKKLMKKSSGRGSMPVTFDGPVFHHVAKAEVFVVMRSSAFHVAIDGRTHGPFHRIKVSLMTDAMEAPITVPFASFLPVNV
eukprot:c5100_g1_i1.p1 GENE.c5100_g1_i1~~c5100_g1_i1.p1  ORF type:complete len:801 (-),score=217.12 c5100_g1_i1:173-2575(-)